MRFQDQSGWRREIGCRRRLSADQVQAERCHLSLGGGAEVGTEFDCSFTGPEGKAYTAHMKVTEVKGDNVEFYVQSRPS
jgi:hypothetical protein